MDAQNVLSALAPLVPVTSVVLDSTGRWVMRYAPTATAEQIVAATVALDAINRTADVITERERRLSLGFDYDFGDSRGVHRIGTTDQDMKGWDEVSKASQAAIALGFPSAPIGIVTNTGPTTVTALEWQQILLAASQARQPIWAASFALQAMNPIPSDYTSDAYWSA